MTTSPTAPVYLYKPTWVANNFILRGRERGVRDISPLKIQKLVYMFHGWHLAVTGKPAVGEQFEAWPKGPVLSSLYHQFKEYRWNRITNLAKDIDPATGELTAAHVPAQDEQFHIIFDAVWDRYHMHSGPKLSAMTHAPDTPWSKARETDDQYISNEAIRQHYIDLARGGSGDGE